jgi:hypothetical protein
MDIQPQTYTDQEATDEAVLLFVRKLRRLHPDAFAAVMGRLPKGARTALMLAENRADVVRGRDRAEGIAPGMRPYPNPYELDDEDDEDDE